ncbi:MAG: hypothetical protein AAGJ28_07725 [Pseudomonadota bacterium]
MALNLTMTNLDHYDPNLSGLFAALQGNILKSHGRDLARHVFLRFTGTPQECRGWLSGIAGKVTSFADQYEQTRAYRENAERSLFTGFLLSSTGYDALGISRADQPDDPAFQAGMKDTGAEFDTRPRGDHTRRANPLNDDPDKWEVGFQSRLDALVILASGRKADTDGSDEMLDAEVERLKQQCEGVAEIVHVELGHVLRNELGQVIEHFGNPDGVSNPTFMRPELDRLRRLRGGFGAYNGSGALDLVLFQDPGGNNDTDYGSYFVYRKLQQNIAGYRRKCAELAGKMQDAAMELRKAAGEVELDAPDIDAEYVNALCVGRFRDGTPISEQAAPGTTNLPNGFNFDHDDRGLRCPFQAHIRKANPRKDTHREFGAPQTVEYSRRIVRRGISYGSEDLMPDEEWTDAGLLFLSCQRSIEYQFIFMQHAWCNNQIFVEEGTGLDPICGAPNVGQSVIAQKWPLRWGIPSGSVAGNYDGSVADHVEFAFDDVVRMRGGEYFHAPSINTLHRIAAQ